VDAGQYRMATVVKVRKQHIAVRVLVAKVAQAEVA
jgi:hypothetical protein